MAIMLISCGEKKSDPSAVLTVKSLANAEYRTEWVDRGTAQLRDGAFKKPYAEGSASAVEITLLPDMYAFGDFDGDGAKDAAVILAASGGGSGTFITLEALINDNGSPRHATTAHLGDRVQVRSISIGTGIITVEMVAHGPDDPMYRPTLEIARQYRLDGNMLIEVK